MTNFQNKFLINSEINNYLDNIVKTKLFSNGYIFYGAEGVGKKQTAINFITGIFKQYSAIDNIEEKINNNNHPDFLVVEPTFLTQIKPKKNEPSISKINTEIIKIDQIRNIRKFFSQRCIESEKKIVLIIDAHLLNEAASNCLLKTLEEPQNGIFILLTSKLNLLLETIKSRCQIVRIPSFSSKKIESYLKNNLESEKLKILKKFNIKDLVNSANGSPKKILEIIEFWNHVSDEITNKLDFPLKNNLEILKISKIISEELEIHQQINLACLIQQVWWRKTKNPVLVKDLENLILDLKNNIQPRLSWEVNLLKIGKEINDT